MVVSSCEDSVAYSDVGEYDYNKEPFITLLHKCLPIVSAQDLSLLTDDIQSYVLSPDQDPSEVTLFQKHPCTQFIFQVFRDSFRMFVRDHQNNKQFLTEYLKADEQAFCIAKITQDYTERMFERMNCYTAGLNVDLIIALSTEEYESESPQKERIAILPSLAWVGKDIEIEFDPSDRVVLEQSNLRALRKQLRTCGDGALAVWKDEKDKVYKTLGIISAETAKELPCFEFKKRAEWYFAVPDFEGNDGRRVRYAKGTFTLPVLNLETIYKAKLAALNIQETEREILQCILGSIQKCEHGAILIIGEKEVIQRESLYLASNDRGVCLNQPIPLIQKVGDSSKSVLKQLAAVDGAIFLDFNGMCYAFGIILDGVVKYSGKNSRGSRYNSTKTYTEWIREDLYPGTTILGVVKSEDGMVDLFDRTESGVSGGVFPRGMEDIKIKKSG